MATSAQKEGPRDMYRRLGYGKLTSGESLELAAVDAPDPDWTGRLRLFLRHKGDPYAGHIERALDQPLDDLRTHFYVGCVDGEPITHVMVAGARGFGVLGHVYTVPEWRRRGAFGQLMATQMEDVRALGFTRLTLSTGYGSMPYEVYSSFGFRSAVPESGQMCWFAEPGSEPAAAPAPAGDTSIRRARWDDWGALCFVLAHAPHAGEPAPRSSALGIDECGSAEGSFLRLLGQLDLAGAQSYVAESSAGGVVGWCHLVPSPLTLGGAWLLDLHVLPGFEGLLGDLLGRVDWPQRPVVFPTSADADVYESAMTAVGFTKSAVLPAGDHGGSTRRLTLWWRTG
ncbi:GNAT family N-acetyltransferase [Actinopolymorpha rutila]|uniref:GNAT superfamily N-acetyltransferase n=1 Tax=Actinopolymorpha rutila TaxID=446787 RepID=A0A852ZDB3_9ACTN|nr:GNAT family N-acetyltransferase [Actinopolymorpha rutila]NYH87689.1 GNAT superfamily N-acetyltransferase [Actinopolymorpha rutila]